eukprot:580103-Hanusia_phi.AAC.1
MGERADLLDATDERLEVAELRVSAGNLHHVAGEGNAGLLADFVEHWGADSPLLDVGHHDGRGASNSDGGTAGLRQAERPSEGAQAIQAGRGREELSQQDEEQEEQEERSHEEQPHTIIERNTDMQFPAIARSNKEKNCTATLRLHMRRGPAGSMEGGSSGRGGSGGGRSYLLERATGEGARNADAHDAATTSKKARMTGVALMGSRRVGVISREQEGDTLYVTLP